MQDATKQRRFPQVSVDYGDEIVGIVDQYARERGVTRSQAFRDLVSEQLRAIGRLADPAEVA